MHATYVTSTVRTRHETYVTSTVRTRHTTYVTSTVRTRHATYVTSTVRTRHTTYVTSTVRTRHATYVTSTVRTRQATYVTSTVRTRHKYLDALMYKDRRMCNSVRSAPIRYAFFCSANTRAAAYRREHRRWHWEYEKFPLRTCLQTMPVRSDNPSLLFRVPISYRLRNVYRRPRMNVIPSQHCIDILTRRIYAMYVLSPRHARATDDNDIIRSRSWGTINVVANTFIASAQSAMMRPYAAIHNKRMYDERMRQLIQTVAHTVMIDIQLPYRMYDVAYVVTRLSELQPTDDVSVSDVHKFVSIMESLHRRHSTRCVRCNTDIRCNDGDD